MSDWLYLWRMECDVERSRFEIESELPDGAVETESGRFEYSQSVAKGFIGTRFEWELISQKGSFRLIEESYISPWLLPVAGFLLFSLLLASGLFGYLTGFVAQVTFAFAFCCIVLFGALIGVQINVDSPVEGLFRKGDNRVQYIPLASFLIAVSPFVILYTVADWQLQLASLAAIPVVTFSYIRYHDTVVDWSIWWQSQLLSRTKRVPLVAGNYLAGLLLVAGIEVLYLLAVRIPFFTVLLRRYPVSFPVLFGAVILFLILFFQRTIGKAQRIESVQFDLYGQTDLEADLFLITGVVVVFGSALFAVLSTYFVSTGIRYVSIVDSPGAYLMTVLCGLPILYYLGGLIYQSSSFIYTTARLVGDAKKCDIDVGQSYPVYLVDSKLCDVGAVSLGYTEFIVISEKLRHKLDEEELEAIISHEEAHFEFGDAGLAFKVGLLSSVLLTGRNILFGVLNFREREFRADRYACSRVGEDQLIQALNSIQELEFEEDSAAIPGFAPTVTRFRSNTPRSVLETVFGFYFGGFALSGAHPSINERKTAIRKQVE
jgi:Zn-dependent protease with chaperone function